MVETKNIKDKIDKITDDLKDEIEPVQKEIKTFMDKYGRIIVIGVGIGFILAIYAVIHWKVF